VNNTIELVNLPKGKKALKKVVHFQGTTNGPKQGTDDFDEIFYPMVKMSSIFMRSFNDIYKIFFFGPTKFAIKEKFHFGVLFFISIKFYCRGANPSSFPKKMSSILVVFTMAAITWSFKLNNLI